MGIYSLGRYLIGVAILALANPSLGITYRIFDLAGSTVPESGAAWGINNAGRVVGHFSTNGVHHSFVWTPESGFRSIDGQLGFTSTEAYGIDDSGHIVGRSITASGNSRAYLYTPGSGFEDLGIMPGYNNSQAWAISPIGQKVVGTSGNGALATIWQASTGLQLLSNMPTYTTANAYDINASGQVVGAFYQGSGPTLVGRAYRWQSGAIDVIEPLPGTIHSIGQCINDQGDVAGYSRSNSVMPKLFLWTEAGGTQDLGRNIFSPTYPYGINRHRHIVGVGGTPFLWTPNAGMVELSTLMVNLPASWRLNSAYGINDNDWIVGDYVLDGHQRSYVAIPIGGTLTGNVALLDFVGTVQGREVRLKFSGGGYSQDATVTLDAGGNFTLDSYLPDGDYEVLISARHFLRVRLTGVSIHLGQANYLSATLTNGDADNDNEVGIGDYALLSSLFGLEEGDTGFSDDADLNGDQAIDIGDYAILSSNYGLSGDE